MERNTSIGTNPGNQAKGAENMNSDQEERQVHHNTETVNSHQHDGEAQNDMDTGYNEANQYNPTGTKPIENNKQD